MVWRGPMVTQALEQLLKDTNWRDLDYLIVDMPPGTGDIQLTLAQKVPVTGAVIVTTPQDIALIDARKGLKMFEKVGVPIVGIVENMSMHVCSNCGHAEHIFGEGGAAKMCADYKVPFLGGLPLDIRIREQTDAGRPTVVADPDGKIAQIYREIARRDRGVRRREGRGLLGQVPEHRDPEHVSGPHAASRRRRARAQSRTRSARSDQVRQMDPPDGGGDGHDRAVRAGPGARGRRPQDRLVRHVELRLRHPLLARIQDLHQHQLDDRRPEGVRRRIVRRFQRRRLHHPAELVRAGAHRRVLPHSAQRADDLPRQKRRTRAAASSST